MLRFSPRYLLLALLATGCGPRGEAPAIGEGFVAPATLNLRKELGPRQPSVDHFPEKRIFVHAPLSLRFE